MIAPNATLSPSKIFFNVSVAFPILSADLVPSLVLFTHLFHINTPAVTPTTIPAIIPIIHPPANWNARAETTATPIATARTPVAVATIIRFDAKSGDFSIISVNFKITFVTTSINSLNLGDTDSPKVVKRFLSADHNSKVSPLSVSILISFIFCANFAYNSAFSARVLLTASV